MAQFKIDREKLMAGWVWLGLAGLIILELLTRFFPSLGRIGMWWWGLSFIPVLGLAIKSTVQIWESAIKKHEFFSWLSWIFLLALVIFYFQRPEFLSGETTIETNCPFTLWSTEDAGFQRPCFLGYPNRQYLIPALPTLLGSRSLAMLNLGGLIYFGLGVTIWLAGLKAFLATLPGPKNHDFLAGLTLFLLPNFHFFNHFIFNSFEQSQFPFSLSLLFWGVLFHYLAQPQPWQLGLLSWSLVYLSVAYTPALAMLVLGISIIFYLALKNKITLSQLVAIILPVLVTFGVSLLYRYDIKIIGQDNYDWRIIGEQLLPLFSQIFIAPHSPLFGSVIGSATLGIASLSFLFSKEKKLWGLSLWVIGSVMLAALAQGYAYYSLAFRLHRSLVVVPTVLFLVVKLSKRMIINWPVGLGICLAVAGCGVMLANSYLSTLKIHDHARLRMTIEEKVSNLADYQSLIFTQKSNQNFVSITDTLSYFWPNLVKSVVESDDFDQPSCLGNLNGRTILVLAVDDSCVTELSKNFASRRLDFSTKDHQELVIFY